MRTKLDKVLLGLGDANILTKMGEYDLISECPSESVANLLEEAITKETNHLLRAYVILLWAEMRLELGYDDEAIAFIEELERQVEIQESQHCLASCYYAEYLFGKKDIKDKVQNILNDVKGD